MSIEYRGETFEGYNKPKRTPNHPTKSHVVLAKEGSTIKLIRFGQGRARRPRPDGQRSRPGTLRTSRRASSAPRGGPISENGADLDCPWWIHW
jgi:hypothetical protein